MNSRRTASEFGQYIEFQTAVLRQLPRPEQMEGDLNYWIKNQSALKEGLHRLLLHLPDIDWQKVYKELGMEKQYAEETAYTDSDLWWYPNLWVIPVLKETTCGMVVSCFRKLGVDVCIDVGGLDKLGFNDRDSQKSSYVVGFCRTVEADEINKELSAEDLAKRNHQGITLLERLLLGLGYFLTTGKHLDVEGKTLCSGSRYVDGGVPRVGDCNNRRMFIIWCAPDFSGVHLRSRSVAVLTI